MDNSLLDVILTLSVAAVVAILLIAALCCVLSGTDCICYQEKIDKGSATDEEATTKCEDLTYSTKQYDSLLYYSESDSKEASFIWMVGWKKATFITNK